MVENLPGDDAGLSAAARQPKGVAIAAMVAGLGALVFALVFFLGPGGMFPMAACAALGVVAVVFGIIALRRRESKGLAVTGLIVGAIMALLALGLIVFALIFIGAFMV